MLSYFTIGYFKYVQTGSALHGTELVIDGFLLSYNCDVI